MPIPGAAGSRFAPLIEALYEQELVRRRPLEQRLETSQHRQQAWFETNRNLTNLRSGLSRLQGFESIFGDRIVNNANENALSVMVRRHTTPAEIEFEVFQRAEADRFYSNELELNHHFNAGSYTFLVGEAEINVGFAGGNINEFVQAINAAEPDLLRASVLRTSLNRNTLFLESQLVGRDNILDFRGDARPLAFDIGLITDRIEGRYQVVSDTNGGLRVGSDLDLSRNLRLQQGRIVNVALSGEAPNMLREGAFIELDYRVRPRPEGFMRTAGQPDNQAQAVREGRLARPGEVDRVVIPEISGQVTIFAQVDGRLFELAGLSESSDFTTIQLDLGQLEGRLENIILANTNTAYEVETQNINVFIPGDVDFIPVNPASRAQDAEFTMDGIRISRPFNEITDVLPDIDFTVRQPSNGAFTVSVRHDVDGALQAIDDFLWLYHLNMAQINIVTHRAGNREVVEELAFFTPEQRELAFEDLGLFQGDQTFLNLKNRLHTIMINAHQIGIGTDDTRMQMRELGIATNLNTGQLTLQAQRRGYFEMNMGELRTALETRWDDVADFFASNSEGAVIPDRGLAFEMNNLINSYVNTGGIIRSRTDNLTRQIAAEQRAIDNFNERLEQQRARWERDFAQAEAAERQMERSMQQMDNMWNNNNNNRR